MLPMEKMRAVMYDMMRADQFVSYYVLKDSTLNREEEAIKSYSQVFAIHGISKEQFSKSFAYYQSNPLLMKEMMDSINRIKDTAAVASPVKEDTVIVRADSLPKINQGDSILSLDSTLLRKKRMKQLQPLPVNQ